MAGRGAKRALSSPTKSENCLRRRSRRRLRQPDEVGLLARFAHLRVLHFVGSRRPIGVWDIAKCAGRRVCGYTAAFVREVLIKSGMQIAQTDFS